jgi:hypothetical protein
MSFTLDLIVGDLPASSPEAWAEIERLRGSYYGDTRDKAPALLQLHERLTQRYPCLCSYADDDPAMDDSPWADGPMINNFASEMGMLAISYSRADEVVPFIIKEALQLGITVADGQSEKIYRPSSGKIAPAKESKPRWKFW